VTVLDDGASPAPPAVAPPALELHGVSGGYGRTTVLRDVTLTVEASQVTALLGPNGAGKTTLLRLVSGFLPATGGRVRLFGDDVTGVAPHRRSERGLCHVPEGRGVFRSLSVRENLLMQAAKGTEGEAIERASSVFPVLGSRLHQVAGTMSGGEQQMLAMAAAYVRSPKLILVDEASLGLAPLIVDQIFAFLEQVTRDGAALLIVDQFATRALDMATTAYVLRHGSIAFSGPAKELQESDLFSQYLGA
jgi:branched-chain amino acid transport system ATP-binding protein